MNSVKRIFIIGHSGSGKALFASRLSEKLAWEFIDADFGLELNIGKPLIDIIGKEGEACFQKTENEILKEFILRENVIITTNGSIVEDKKNCSLLKEEFVIYLQVTTPIQVERIARNQQPLIPISNMTNFLDAFHAKRDGLYESIASVIIDSTDTDLDKHIAKIMQFVNLSGSAIDKTSALKKELIIFHKTLHTPIKLSQQQGVCLNLLVQGKSSKEIARVMAISYRTVEGYIANMIEMTGCDSSKELVALYHRP